MLHTFASLPAWALSVAYWSALLPVLLPLLVWPVHRVRDGRWSFAVESVEWHRAVSVLVSCWAVAGALLAAAALCHEAANLTRRAESVASPLDDELLVAAQRRFGVNLDADGRDLSRVASYWSPVDVRVVSPPDLAARRCVVEYRDDVADALAGRDVSSLDDLADLPAAERASVLDLRCDGEPVEAQPPPLGVPVEVERAAPDWPAWYPLVRLVGSAAGGAGLACLVLYVVYSISSRLEPPLTGLALLRPADTSVLAAARREVLDEQWARMESDPHERRRVEAYVDRWEQEMGRVLDGVDVDRLDLRTLRVVAWEIRGGVDPAITDPDDQVLARYLRKTGRDPDGIFARPPDRWSRGMFLALLCPVLSVPAAWWAVNADAGAAARTVATVTRRTVDEFVRHYTAVGFDVDVPDDAARAEGPEWYFLTVDLVRGDVVCRGEVVGGFALAACQEPQGTTYR